MEVAPSPAPRILIVDDDESVRDVISVLLREEGYNCLVASGAEMALDIAAAEETPLVISDMRMPGRDGLWLLESFRQRYPDTSVIMLTGYGDTEAAVDSLRKGAVDYLLKPPRLTDLIRAIERALAKRRIEMARRRYQKKLERKVRDRTFELRAALKNIANTYQNTLLALVAALDAREHETSDHSQRVVRYTMAIAAKLGISGQELEEIGRGALLHDIGKIGVPDAVLLKPGKLTPVEWAEMRKHPDIGYQMIQNIPFLSIPATIVLSHQERYDGEGYPRNLRKDEIHIGARIFAVADTLDAMTSDRPYRKGTTFANAILEIYRCRDSQFDPEVVRAFLDIGELALFRIRQEMAAAKAPSIAELDGQARTAEAEHAAADAAVEKALANSPPPGGALEEAIEKLKAQLSEKDQALRAPLSDRIAAALRQRFAEIEQAARSVEFSVAERTEFGVRLTRIDRFAAQKLSNVEPADEQGSKLAFTAEVEGLLYCIVEDNPPVAASPVVVSHRPPRRVGQTEETGSVLTFSLDIAPQESAAGQWVTFNLPPREAPYPVTVSLEGAATLDGNGNIQGIEYTRIFEKAPAFEFVFHPPIKMSGVN